MQQSRVSGGLCVMRRLLCLVALLLVGGALWASPGKRVALVMGNAAYRSIGSLHSPALDAVEMGKKLQQLGFDVEVAVDQDREGMAKAIHAFYKKLLGAEVALFFYSGHGVAIRGNSYLLPISAAPEDEDQVEYQAVAAQPVVARMQEMASVAIVVLDACRNSLPTLRGRGKSASKGVVVVSPGPGDVAVLYSTAPDKEALDGARGQLSPFTRELLVELGTRGATLHDVMTRVVARVRQTTQQQQQPYSNVSLSRALYLAGPCAAGTRWENGQCQTDGSSEAASWEMASEVGDARAYEAYLRKHPQGPHAPQAQQRIAALQSAGPASGTVAPRAVNTASAAPIEAASAQHACDRGDSESCIRLGLAYVTGSKVAKDKARGAELFKQACDRGDAQGCGLLGYAYETSTGVSKDEVRAAALYQQACNGSDARSCGRLGALYEKGSGVNHDDLRGAVLYQRACDGGDAVGCRGLGSLYERGSGVPKDAARAAVLYQRACDGGDAAGCRELGSLHGEGSGVIKDAARAVVLYQRACNEGDPQGCRLLAFAYKTGTGVNKDAVRAAFLYQTACDAGDPFGCLGLGVLYEFGVGVNMDAALAAALYLRACDGGAADACSRLGHMHEIGIGVPRNMARAAALYRRACEGGEPDACKWAPRRPLERIDPRPINPKSSPPAL